ncbi:uncharacterized protein PG998_004157 [Apiospora kogelbergensis]|uniref:uncharacterized protein n=1 Tax=Apiospora kogelbergensis TaxID=1337665 RepID=UPI003130C0E9
MSDSDLFISNGTCYFATNRKAAETFIPCGNAANAAYTCCFKGDVCLEGSVCFHPDGNSGGTTYIAGCTDPGFGSVAGACPHKGKFADQQIVGLGLFRQKPTIEAVATLPTALGQTVLFVKGHEPSPSFKQTTSPRTGDGFSTVALSSTITVIVPSHTGSPLVKTAHITSSASFTPTDFPVSAAKASDGSDHGLPTGAKAGIAVGVILAVLVSSAIFFLAMTMQRRRRKLSGDINRAAATKPRPPTEDNIPGPMTAAREPSPLPLPPPPLGPTAIAPAARRWRQPAPGTT